MNDVAAWFIDDDYDEESFFVRQAYFVGQDHMTGCDARSKPKSTRLHGPN